MPLQQGTSPSSPGLQQASGREGKGLLDPGVLGGEGRLPPESLSCVLNVPY